MPLPISLFKEIWIVDFEFVASDGETPSPVVCLVAHEINSGKIIRQWMDELGAEPPYSIRPDSLVVAYYASAEMGCHLALGWGMAENILDLYPVFRERTNGEYLHAGRGLIGAMTYYGLDVMEAAEKEDMRQLVMRGPPYTPEEKVAIIDYCESDVIATKKLFQAIIPYLEPRHIALHGRYMKAAAVMERNGVPLDVEALAVFKASWPNIKEKLITEIDRDYGVYENGSFKEQNFKHYLQKRNISWPLTVTGKLKLDDKTFKDVAKRHSELQPLKELRATLDQLKLGAVGIPVGRDNRNRCMLSAFSSKTGRNQPSNSKFIFGPAVWMRGLIQPPPGHGLAYIDWSQQEFGIAAALSGDQSMIASYESGDPYLQFAKLANAVPADATKDSHPNERNIYKQCVLAVQYGMGAESLARAINKPIPYAQELLEKHRQVYRVFWRWSDGVVNHALLKGSLHTVFGWRLNTCAEGREPSLRNFPMQANGAEILRLACIFGTERGIEICAPVHDAVLISSPLDMLEHDIAVMQQCMEEASNIVLSGFKLRSEAKIFCHPERYMDERGVHMWNKIMELCGLDDRKV